MGRLFMIILSLLVTILSLANTASTACVDSCVGQSNGNYQHCSDCRKYVACSNGNINIMPCPPKLVWDDNNKVCDWNSTTCSLPTSATTNIPTATVCVDSCVGKSDGNYQHCSDCGKYVACSNGYIYIMSCPSILMWDDIKKRCELDSETCLLSTSATKQTSTPTTNKQVTTGRQEQSLLTGSTTKQRPTPMTNKQVTTGRQEQSLLTRSTTKQRKTPTTNKQVTTDEYY